MRAKKKVLKNAQVTRERDAQWTRALGVEGKVLTPEEGKEWLKLDRIIRARNVSDARRLRGPYHW